MKLPNTVEKVSKGNPNEHNLLIMVHKVPSLQIQLPPIGSNKRYLYWQETGACFSNDSLLFLGSKLLIPRFEFNKNLLIIVLKKH